MSIEQNKEFVQRFYDEVFNRHNLAYLDEAISPHLMDHSDSNPTGDFEGAKQWFELLDGAFPDLSITVLDILGEDDMVVARIRTEGTHSGEFMGIAATGRKIVGTGIDILRLENGKIVEHWGQFDNLGMMKQLGAIPAAA